MYKYINFYSSLQIIFNLNKNILFIKSFLKLIFIFLIYYKMSKTDDGSTIFVRPDERELLSDTLKIIIDDKNFIDEIEKQINNVAKDGKVDANDIPQIMVIVTECYNNINNFHVSYEEIPDLLTELLEYILNKNELIREEDRDAFTLMIENAIKLIMFQPNIKKKCIKLFSKFKC